MKKSPRKMSKCQGMYNASENDCHKSGCNHVKTKSGASYCRSPMKRIPKSPKKSPKRKMSKCQGMYNASKNDCHNSGCNYVKTKSGTTYCRSPMKRRPRKSPMRKSPRKSPMRKSPRKSPMRKMSKCQGKNGASLGDCHKIGCNFVKPKVGPTYCRSPMNRKSKSPRKSPKIYAKKTRKSPTKSPNRYAKKTRKSPRKSPLRMNVVELE